MYSSGEAEVTWITDQRCLPFALVVQVPKFLNAQKLMPEVGRLRYPMPFGAMEFRVTAC